MKIRKLLVFILMFVLVWSCRKEISDPEIEEANRKFDPGRDQIVMAKKEIRAAWIATVGNYDWPTSKSNPDAQKSELIYHFEHCKNLNFNAVILQIRPVADAFYPSNLEPWSVYLTGVQGQNPGYDPLQFAVEEAHKRGLEFHAWLNPYRIGSTSAILVANHPAVVNPTWVVVFNGVRYFNPGLPEVRAHLTAVVKDIISRYDVDAIHFDDYFYPSGSKSTSNPFAFDDKASFEKYGNGKDIHSWRAENVNLMVAEVKQAIQANKPTVLFGISPSGRRENSVDLYADPFVWLDNKWVDYLAPQIYWEFGHSTADFAKQAAFWNSNARGIPMVIGLAAYKFKDAQYPAYSTVDEFRRQIDEVRKLPQLSGCFYFRMKHIEIKELADFLRNKYNYKSLLPLMGNPTKPQTATPVISLNTNTISWQSVAGADKFAVYLLVKDDSRPDTFIAQIVQIGNELKFQGESGKTYFVTAVNKSRLESLPSNLVTVN